MKLFICKYSLLVFCLTLFSCKNTDTIEVPDDILPREKMAQVMVDIHLLEAAMNVTISSADKASSNLKVDIFRKNGITKEQFEESYTFYTENPEALGEVYQLVLNDLSKLQSTVANGK